MSELLEANLLRTTLLLEAMVELWEQGKLDFLEGMEQIQLDRELEEVDLRHLLLQMEPTVRLVLAGQFPEVAMEVAGELGARETVPIVRPRAAEVEVLIEVPQAPETAVTEATAKSLSHIAALVLKHSTVEVQHLMFLKESPK